MMWGPDRGLTHRPRATGSFLGPSTLQAPDTGEARVGKDLPLHRGGLHQQGGVQSAALLRMVESRWFRASEYLLLLKALHIPRSVKLK